MSASGGHASYPYSDGGHTHSHSYLLPTLQRFLLREQPKRVFEVGCGNGSMAAWMHGRGIEVTGIDYSVSGIAQAKQSHPGVRFELGSAYDDLAATYGSFPVVVSLEVVEHLYEPRRFAAVVYDLLEPGGAAIISTPYHGYLKNLALAVTGKLDAHFTALWDGGHIKFWSLVTLGKLLQEAGFVDIEFERVGRIPVFAKSMVAIARKPKIVPERVGADG